MPTMGYAVVEARRPRLRNRDPRDARTSGEGDRNRSRRHCDLQRRNAAEIHHFTVELQENHISAGSKR